jgi:succinoglycan biosynthesis protein ExoI
MTVLIQPTSVYPALTLAAVLFAVLGACGGAQAPGALKKGDLITGSAAVVDGNSFDIKSNRIRLWGIDTPERGAWCYRNGRRWKPMDDAVRALRHCVEAKTVTCRVQKVERAWFRRWHTSECWTDDGQDVGECMIRAGWATDYTCFSDGYYRDLETEAKIKGLGVWQCDNGPTTRRWGREGPTAKCEAPIYRPSGPGPK